MMVLIIAKAKARLNPVVIQYNRKYYQLWLK